MSALEVFVGVHVCIVMHRREKSVLFLEQKSCR